MLNLEVDQEGKACAEAWYLRRDDDLVKVAESSCGGFVSATSSTTGPEIVVRGIKAHAEALYLRPPARQWPHLAASKSPRRGLVSATETLDAQTANRRGAKARAEAWCLRLRVNDGDMNNNKRWNRELARLRRQRKAFRQDMREVGSEAIKAAKAVGRLLRKMELQRELERRS